MGRFLIVVPTLALSGPQWYVSLREDFQYVPEKDIAVFFG